MMGKIMERISGGRVGKAWDVRPRGFLALFRRVFGAGFVVAGGILLRCETVSLVFPCKIIESRQMRFWGMCWDVVEIYKSC